MIVTIDGPAGAGKSSVARLLAKRLDFDFLDTGAMYRAVALAALRRELDLSSDDQLGRLVDQLRLEMHGDVVVLDGEDVSALLRSPEVTAATGQVADRREVRVRLNEQQRRIAAESEHRLRGARSGDDRLPGGRVQVLPARRAARTGPPPLRRTSCARPGDHVRGSSGPAGRARRPGCGPRHRPDGAGCRRDPLRQHAAHSPRSRRSDGGIRPTADGKRSMNRPAQGNHGLRDAWSDQLLHLATRIVSTTAFSLGFSIRWEGTRNMPAEGPVLAIANHQSYFDPPAIGLATNAPARLPGPGDPLPQSLLRRPDPRPECGADRSGRHRQGRHPGDPPAAPGRQGGARLSRGDADSRRLAASASARGFICC